MVVDPDASEHTSKVRELTSRQKANQDDADATARLALTNSIAANNNNEVDDQTTDDMNLMVNEMNPADKRIDSSSSEDEDENGESKTHRSGAEYTLTKQVTFVGTNAAAATGANDDDNDGDGDGDGDDDGPRESRKMDESECCQIKLNLERKVL